MSAQILLSLAAVINLVSLCIMGVSVYNIRQAKRIIAEAHRIEERIQAMNERR
jgi:hypothetical protein